MPACLGQIEIESETVWRKQKPHTVLVPIEGGKDATSGHLYYICTHVKMHTLKEREGGGEGERKRERGGKGERNKPLQRVAPRPPSATPAEDAGACAAAELVPVSLNDDILLLSSHAEALQRHYLLYWIAEQHLCGLRLCDRVLLRQQTTSVSRCSSSENVSHRKRGRLVLLCVNDVFQIKLHHRYGTAIFVSRTASDGWKIKKKVRKQLEVPQWVWYGAWKDWGCCTGCVQLK